MMIVADNENRTNSAENTSNIIVTSESEGENDTQFSFKRRKMYEQTVADYLGITPNGSFNRTIRERLDDPNNTEKNYLKRLARVYYDLELYYKKKAREITRIIDPEKARKAQDYQEEFTS